MTEKLPLTLNVPIDNTKPYKIVKKLREIIDQVTKDYSYDDTYINEVDNKPCFAIVFFFYSKTELQKAIDLFNTLNSNLSTK